jgi:hypothetical protein
MRLHAAQMFLRASPAQHELFHLSLLRFQQLVGG